MAERLLTADKVERIEKRLADVGNNYDTGNLSRVYCQDVALLLREVKVLERDLELTVVDQKRFTDHYIAVTAERDELRKQVQKLAARCEAAEKHVTVKLDQEQVDEILADAKKVRCDDFDGETS